MNVDAAGLERDFRSLFSDLAARLGDGDAILAPGREPLSFAGLSARVQATKESLNRLGLGRGDRVVIALPSGPEMAVCLVSTIACCVAIPLNPSYTGNELRQYLGRIRPKAVILPAGAESPARAVADELGARTIELAPDLSAPAGTFALAGVPMACPDPSWNAAEDVGVILLTSGTTSREKLVPLKLRHLTADALGINAVLGLGPTDRSLLVMPLFHASGIYSSFLVPLINGAAVVCLGGFEVASFFRRLDEYRPTWITAGYAFLKALYEGVPAHRDAIERSRVRFIRSGTGGLDPEVRRGLEAAFGAPVIEQYSSTETGPVACSRLPPARDKRGSVGQPVYNEVAVMDPGGALLQTDQEGEIVVRGPSVFEGYLDDPEANAAAFSSGWYRTGDRGRLDADGFLTITGRVKELINRGGEKISPQEVEAVMVDHGAVREIKVLGIPHPSLGEEVIAAVVLRETESASEADLKAFAAGRLADFKVPRRIFFREALPSLPSGKLDLRALARECEQLVSAERARPAPASDRALSATEARIVDIWRKALALDRVGPGEDFFMLGGDSLRAIELLMALEQEFGVDMPVSALYGGASTVSGMAAEIDRLRAGTDHPLEHGRASGAADDLRATPQYRGRRAALRVSDVLTLLTFLTLAPVAWLLPFKTWLMTCQALARAHVVVRGSRAGDLGEALATLKSPMTAEQLEKRFLSGVYLDILITLREHLPLPWRPRIRLSGAEHVEAALAAGRGAVLWSSPSTQGGVISKKALKAAGIGLISVRSDIHPYSDTRFGMKLLNPVRTSIEDRYLAGSVTVRDSERLGLAQELRGMLKANRAINIVANGLEGSPLLIPFLGGTLALSLGAPTLAVLNRSPLLPVFAAADDYGGFDVTVGPPFEVPPHGSTVESVLKLTQGYATMLEAHLRHHPTEWRGWFNRGIWSPWSPTAS